MVRTQYYTATSADGFIADADNSLDWLFEVPHDDDADAGGWDEFIAGVGVMAMGSTTYEWVLEHDQILADPAKWKSYYDERPCWVFTHRELPPIPGVDIRFVSGPVESSYDDMVAASDGRNLWVVGGGDLVGQFDDARLLDEIILNLTPVFLGSGAPLLPRRITSSRVRLRSAYAEGQRVRITFDVSRDPS
ncbi:dihydrofolate reductase family protein [Nocardioides sp. Root151]|uniref:dihydrofolate reductase family protein n=1 Tax=Nocardioides sp. Root151 TaxID=1736475 RepID=UPI000702DC9E|nr:dihydrofolate reductase family protein [Nocardioides sp. Root151]KQZ70114.1 deaminase [Nocardioides sp. Root151]